MVLITGGNGLVGSRLAAGLAAEKHRVRVLGLPQPGHDAELRSLGIEVMIGDVTNSSDLTKAMAGVRTVFHLAAVLASPEDPSRFRRINAEGTRLALSAAESARVAHFIFISSISVAYPVHNAYSASKAEAERHVAKSACPWTIVRPCLVLDGKGGGAEYCAFANAVRRWPILFLPRRGAARKRPVHVEDLCLALIRMAENPRCFGKTYALGGSEIVSLRAIAEAMLCGRKQRKPVVPIAEKPLRIITLGVETASRLIRKRISWASRQSLHGLLYDAAPEIQAAREDLGFVPRGFAEILREEIASRPAGSHG